MSFPVKAIDIRFSTHATEDPEKVKQAVRNLLPEKWVEEIVFGERSLRGHYRNPITLCETRITKRQMIEDLLKKLSADLSSFDKQTILEESDLFIDRSSLYLRFDKQSALKNTLKLKNADPIRMRIRFKSQSQTNILETCSILGLTR